MTLNIIPRLSISASRAAACFFQSGVSRTRNLGSSPKTAKRIIRGEGPAYALVHHSQTVIRECLIIHQELLQHYPPESIASSRRCLQPPHHVESFDSGRCSHVISANVIGLRELRTPIPFLISAVVFKSGRRAEKLTGKAALRRVPPLTLRLVSEPFGANC
jgi:hypothetical protein